MAYTLVEVQAVLTNLKATYLALSLKAASELSMKDRNIVFAKMKDVRAEIESWEAREQALTDVAASQDGTGVAYVHFQRPS